MRDKTWNRQKEIKDTQREGKRKGETGQREYMRERAKELTEGEKESERERGDRENEEE